MSGKPRGGKKKVISHKGGNRRFTDFEELKQQAIEIKEMKNKPHDEETDEEERKVKFAEITDSKAGPADKVPTGATKSKPSAAANKKGSSADESSSESESDEDSDGDKKKGIQHLIEIENPNRVKQKMKKVTELKLDESQLSRREREALEKEKKRQDYLRMHAQGKTEEAQADLARLQIIRKQRDEAAKKREADKAAKEEAEKKQQTEKLVGGVTAGKRN